MNKTQLIFAVFLFAITVVLLPCPQVAAALPVEKTTGYEYTDFKYIPGVTQEEIDAIERIRATRDSLEFGVMHSSSAFHMIDGDIGGFYPLLAEHLGSLFNIPFKVAIFDKFKLYSRIAEGETDFTSAIPLDAKKEYHRLVVETGIQEPVFIYRKHSTKTTQTENVKDQTLRLAFLESSQLADKVLPPNTNFEPVFVSSYEDALFDLKSGAISAFVDYYSTAIVFFDKQPGIVSSEFLPLFHNPVAISTGNPDLAAFISVIEKHLKNNGQQTLNALHKRGETDYKRNRLFLNLSNEERAFIAAHKDTPIPFAASYDNYPICFYDENRQEYQGISIAVLHKIEELTGLTFEPSNKRGEIWRNLLDDLEHGRTAFASELIYTVERSGRFLWTDSPYSVDSYALISLVERDDITIEQIPNYHIGVISGTGYTDDFKKWFPAQKKLTEFSTYACAFNALAVGDVDFVMGTKNLLLNNANYLEKTGFRANFIFDYEYESAYGFHSSQQMLRDIFSKAQNLIDVDGITQRWILRVYDYQGKLEREKNKNNLRIMAIVAILSSIVVVLIIAVFAKRKHTAESLNKILEETVKQRTAELEHQSISAQEASKAKSDFLARMSHEIRTPLNAVIGLSQIAKQASTPGTRAYSATNDAISASMHLLGILNEVLDMTKIEAGKLLLAVESFPLKEAMYEVICIIDKECVEKNLTFEHNIDGLAAIMVDGDKMHIKQVLINLLGNAAKFTPAGGTIGLRVDCLFPCGNKTAQAVFVVYDNGIGIPEDQLEKIYLAFEQASASIATCFGGLGLGLSISQKLVSMMGGTITVKSQVSVGSTFTFTLALPIMDASPEQDENKPESLNLSGKRILLAEDVEINRVILIECMGETNVQIDEAEDGLIACTMFEQSPHGYYDLILMDMQMPNMDGCSATEKIRALDRPDAKTIPIIAVTANAFQDDIDRVMKAGMNRHLPKPINFGQLMSTIKEILP